MADKKEVQRLEGIAYEVREKLIQLCGTYEGAVHIGGDLSAADLMVGLFHHGLKLNPDNISDPARDRFILSKGHSAVLMYITMALRGFWSYESIVKTYGQLDSPYGMHPCRVQLPALECSSGSLGQGLAMAVGMAISAKNRGEGHRVVCFMGDGETAEGSVWEAATVGASQKLGNLVAVVDRNKQFMTSFSEDLVQLEPYPSKWAAFGWNVMEINGHNMNMIVDALDSLPPVSSLKPTVIVANTVKGKGVDFMEHNLGWHAGRLGDEDFARALESLRKNYPNEAGKE
jgi:transketolase